MRVSRENLNTYGFIAVVCSFMLFVLADSGLISKKWLTQASDVDEQQVEINELKAEFSELKSKSQLRRKNLSALINQLHEIDSSLEKEEKEIQLLQFAKIQLEEKAKRQRNIASAYKNVYEKRAAQWNFESWNEVIHKVQEITHETASVRNDGAVVSFHNNDAFSESSHYMKPEGLRVVQAIAAGARRLNADSISVTYAGEEKEKAQVARRYFKSLLGEEIPVTTKKVAENIIKAPEMVEFWVNLKTEDSQ